MKDFFLFFKTERGKINGVSAMLAGVSAMFAFMGYAFIRSASESIFLSYFPAKDKVYALAITPVTLFLLIYLYGVVLSKFGSKKAMIIYFIFSVITSFGFYLFLDRKISYIAFMLLIFKEAYVVILSEMYWSYINSILKPKEAKLINGPMAGLGALGSVIGDWLVSVYSVKLNTDYMVLFSVFCLLPALLFFVTAYNRSGEPQPDEDEKGGKQGHIHISILFKNKVVFLIAVIIFLSQVVSTLSDINFSDYVKKAINDVDLRTSYFGSFWLKVNIISFTTQFLITPIVLRRFSIRYVLVLIPLMHFFTSLNFILNPSLFSASLVLLLFKSMDYSIYRAAKEILYIPFSFDTRYRVKQVVDAFGYRFSKGFTSLTLSFMNILSVSFMGFLMPLVAFFSLLWSYSAYIIKPVEE